jgi:hypothetical protein
MEVEQSKYNDLINQIGELLKSGREQVAKSANTILVRTYWLIGRHIVEFEQGGKEKAEYGSFLFEQLSKDLTKVYGKGFSRSNLLYMRKLYLTYPKSETLSNVLSWSHYFEILRSDNELEIEFYTKQTEKENWSVRELKRQLKSMLFHRLALSKDKRGVLELSKKAYSFGFDNNIYWFVFEISNTSDEELFFDSRNMVGNNQDLYILDNNKLLRHYKNGFDVAIKNRDIKSFPIRFQLEKSQNTLTYLFKVESKVPLYTSFEF